MYNLEGKGFSKLNFIAKVCCWGKAVIVKELGAIKERPDLHWDKGKAVLGERLHPVKLPACERKSSGSFLFLEDKCKQCDLGSHAVYPHGQRNSAMLSTWHWL